MSNHLGPCQKDRSSLLHRRKHHTENLDPAGHEDRRESKLVHKDHTSAHFHIAELQKNKRQPKTVRWAISNQNRMLMHTYDTAPGTSSGCRPLCDCILQHRRQWLCTDTRNPHLSHSYNMWGIKCIILGFLYPRDHENILLLSLTHRHQKHTTHNTVGRAPQSDTERKAPESKLHTSSWPRSLCVDLTRQKLYIFCVFVCFCFFNATSQHVCAAKYIELTAHGSLRSWSATSGQDGLTFQEFPNSSDVDSMMPWRVVKSFSVSPSKFPHKPPTCPWRKAASRM